MVSDLARSSRNTNKARDAEYKAAGREGYLQRICPIPCPARAWAANHPSHPCMAPLLGTVLVARGGGWLVRLSGSHATITASMEGIAPVDTHKLLETGHFQVGRMGCQQHLATPAPAPGQKLASTSAWWMAEKAEPLCERQKGQPHVQTKASSYRRVGRLLLTAAGR